MTARATATPNTGAKFSPTFDESRRYFEAKLPGQRIGSQREVSVKCPFHDDGRASMSINLERGLWHCHSCGIGGGLLDFERKLTDKPDAECWTAINATIGRDAPKASKSERGRIVATYDYHDAAGKIVYQAVRFAEPKGFSQRRPDGRGDWIYNMDGVTRVPFNLPLLVRSNAPIAHLPHLELSVAPPSPPVQKLQKGSVIAFPKVKKLIAHSPGGRFTIRLFRA